MNNIFPTTISEINGVSIQSLAQKYGTPFYAYDFDTITRRVKDLIDVCHVRYAVKANCNLSVLKHIRELGVLADSVSEGEIERAIRAGWKTGNSSETFPTEIAYTCDVFERSSLDAVRRYNLSVNCGSIDMISQLGAMKQNHPEYKNDRITIRINPGFGHGHSQKTNTGGPSSKHGIWHEDLKEACAVAKKHGLTVAGLHVHIGSGADFEHLKTVFDAVENFSLKVGDSLEMISAGGGLPVPYTPEGEVLDVARYASMWSDSKSRIEKELGKSLSHEIEPGRYLVADSGYLVAEIRAIKRMGHLTYYLVDAGFNNLARPILYGSYHHISLVSEQKNVELNEVVVAGPLCESGDVFTQGDGGFVVTREVPKANVGDLLVFHTAGAYGATMSSNYNSKPLCAEIAISDGKEKCIRKRQEISDILSLEEVCLS